MYKKLVRVALLFTLYPLSFLVPRKKNLWLFGCYSNQFADNSKYQYLWTTHNAKDIEAVWISGSKSVVEKLRSEGYTAYMRWSWAGLLVGLRADVYVYSSYLEDINFFTSGTAMRVNLWHGVGLKKIEFKIKEGPLKKYYRTAWWNPYRLLVPSKFARPDLFLSTSPLMTEHFSECFRIPTTMCFEGMYPRLTLHRDPKLMEKALKFGPYEEIKETLGSFQKKWIYMPTWRDNQSGGISVAIPEVVTLNSALVVSNSVLVIKTHPNEKLPDIAAASNILIWNNEIDIYPLLNSFDGLITDYSSILYDFIAIGKSQVILYNYDFEEYTTQSRDFAYPYKENITGRIVTDYSQLCKQIERQDNLLNSLNEKIKDKFWKSKEKNSKNIHIKITKIQRTR
ncbi:CDP-glycerol glycerophosphotransferase family protein [Limnohabitans sp.]